MLCRFHYASLWVYESSEVILVWYNYKYLFIRTEQPPEVFYEDVYSLK